MTKGMEKTMVTGQEIGAHKVSPQGLGWDEAAEQLNSEQQDAQGEWPQCDLDGTILADGLTLGTDMYETGLNNNILIVGTPGGGKTQSHVKPNIYQGNSSIVVLDPKGSLIEDCGWMLEQMGYEVQCINLLNPDESDGYNPLKYVHSAEDITLLAHAIVYSSGEDRGSKDAFWDEAPKILLRAVITLAKELHGDKANMEHVVDLSRELQRGPIGSGTGFRTRLEQRFGEIASGVYYKNNGAAFTKSPQPEHPAVQLWDQFKAIVNVDTTYSCIVMELWTKLSVLTSRGLMNILASGKTLDLGDLGRRRIALFVVVPDTNRSLDYLVSIFYTQLFDELCRVARNECADNDERLNVPVRVIMDDFANQAPIPNFDTLIAALRSRDIWLTPVCQSVAQLQQKYGVGATTIMGCCDTTVFLGVNDIDTAREISQRADLPVAEIQQMPLDQAIVFMRGRKPFIGKRYDVTEHPNYRFSRSADRRNAYSVRKPRVVKRDLLDDREGFVRRQGPKPRRLGESPLS